jgi:hypothetical protein
VPTSPAVIVERHYDQGHLADAMDECKILSAKQILDGWKTRRPADIREAEFKVFSQWGEDGIIQWIIASIPNPIPVFIEFGVENYTESNTRFLLMHNNWSGLIMDGSSANMDYVRNQAIYWRHDLRAIDAFINRDNIDSLISSGKLPHEIGILSVDLDGVDYWVLENIKSVDPQIIICEINGVFGGALPVTVPYSEDFQRLSAHYSGQYFGASLKAMELMLGKKGYSLIGVNSNTVNAFFVRNDLAKHFTVVKSEDVWLPPKHSDTRGSDGNLTCLRGNDEKLRLIRELPLTNIVTNETISIGELFNLS